MPTPPTPPPTTPYPGHTQARGPPGPPPGAETTVIPSLLAAMPVGGSNAGIAVSRGRLFLGTGNIFSGGFNQPGSITALGRRAGP